MKSYAMTANLLRLRNLGVESTLACKEMLLQMVGWNAVTFARQTVAAGRFRIMVETHFG